MLMSIIALLKVEIIPIPATTAITLVSISSVIQEGHSHPIFSRHTLHSSSEHRRLRRFNPDYPIKVSSVSDPYYGYDVTARVST